MKREINPQELVQNAVADFAPILPRADGWGQGCKFLNLLQKEIRELKF